MSAAHTTKRYMNLLSVIVFIAGLFLVSGNTVFAVPYLQLDAFPAGYVEGDEQSIVTTELQFTLYALVNTEKGSSGTTDGNFYISVAIIPDPGYDVSGHSLGSYEFGGETFNVTADGFLSDEETYYEEMEYGIPPLDAHLLALQEQDKNLPSHGVYDTYYREHLFTLDEPTGQADLYNSQDNPGGPLQEQFYDPEGALYYQAFSVDASGLTHPPYRLHFDFYTKGSGIVDFAPFSHDVLAAPIPASVILGMLGLGVVGLKLRKYA